MGKKSKKDTPFVIGGLIGATFLFFAAFLVYTDVPEPSVSIVEPEKKLFLEDETPLAGYSQILKSKHDDLKIYNYSSNNRVLVLDYPSLLKHGKALNRITALLEIPDAPRDRLLDDVELAELIKVKKSTEETLAFGGDIEAVNLVRFFNLATKDNILLNKQELELKQILQDNNFMKLDGVFKVVQPEKALLSIVQEHPDNPDTEASEEIDASMRAAILRHELSHGEFFTNSAYKKHCENFWNLKLNDTERALFREFLGRNLYDVTDEELMINETQAFLMHSPDKRFFEASLLGLTEEQLSDVRARFMEDEPPISLFDEAAAIFLGE